MKCYRIILLLVVGTFSLLASALCLAQKSADTNDDSSSVAKLIERVGAATTAAKTITADFTYTVTSVKQQQTIVGKMRLMKPNFSRLTFSYIARPTFPLTFACDGKTRFIFQSDSFKPMSPLATIPAAFDPVLEAKYASGLLPGGGKITTIEAKTDGSDLHLWDAVPYQAFFGVESAIRNYVYASDLNELDIEKEQKIAGVTYRILHHHFKNGNIAGGESTPFEQRLYIGPDDLIHMHVLEFTSLGRTGIQVMKLTNLKVNAPMKEEDFTFTLPTAK